MDLEIGDPSGMGDRTALPGAIPMIRLQRISRSFVSGDGETTDVLVDLDFEAAPSSFTVIRGKSGSGKTTLLRILGLLDTGYDGTFAFGGIDVQGRPDWFLDEMRSANIGFIFQEGRLFEHLTLRQNIDLPLRLQRPDEAGRDAVDALSARFFDDTAEMARILDLYPGPASGGQKQRGSIIRAIAARPGLVLADEPTASLHGDLKLRVVEHLQQLAAAGHTVIVVSHDDVFYGVGRQLELLDGALVEYRDAPALPAPANALSARMPQEGKALLWGWKPRSPLPILLGQSLRDMLARPLFLFLILVSLMVGACQVSVFASIIFGSEQFIEEKIREGSRLNRIQVKPRPSDRGAEDRFPMRAEIRAWDTVAQAVPRRTMTVRFSLPSGRKTPFTAMGLQPDDPEYDLLVFAAGGPFSEAHEGLEIIVTTSLVNVLFEEAAETGDAAYYDRFVGRTAEALIPQFSSEGDLLRQVPVQMRVVGVILHAEGDRQLYLPSITIRALDRFKRSRDATMVLPLNEEGTAWNDTTKVRELADFAWEDSLHVYMRSIGEVIPTLKRLGQLGLAPRSDIWKFKWALDIQDTALKIFIPLLVLIVTAVAITVAANIFTGAKLRETELALWRILGMRRGDLVLTQVVSTVVSVVIGTTIGLLLGYLLVLDSKTRLAGSAAEQAAQTGAKPQNFDALFAPVQDFFGIILFGALVIGILAALYPAYRTARVDPAKVLQG